MPEYHSVIACLLIADQSFVYLKAPCMKSNPGYPASTTNPLADLLVKEFRTCQDLHYLIREERKAVLNRDVRLVEALTFQKQRLIEELNQLDLAIQSKIEDIGQSLIVKGHSYPILSTATILAEYDRETSGQLHSLYEGIQALKEKITAMDSINQTLAVPASSNHPQLLP